MVEFTHYFIYGYPTEGGAKAVEEWTKVAEKMNMEVVYWGVSIGTTEDVLIVLKGKISDFEKLYSEKTVPPLKDRRTTFGGKWN